MTDESKSKKVDEEVRIEKGAENFTIVKKITTTVHRVSFSRKLASLLAAYEAWVGSHASLARNVETTLYVAPQLVPKNVMEPETVAQFGYSLVRLLHLYHDYILWKKYNKKTNLPTYWQKLTRLIRVPLSLISYVEVLAEVVARRVGGDVGKWRLIVWIEVVKAGLRLTLLAQRRRLMLIRGGNYNGVESGPRSPTFARFTKAKQLGTRTGKSLSKPAIEPKMNSVVENSADKSNKISFEDATIEFAKSSRDSFLIAGEVCHILRPVVYALLRRRRSANSWTPVFLSLVVELTGLAFSTVAVKQVELVEEAYSDKATNELAARKMALLLYLLRDPVFATVTKPVSDKAADIVDCVPGIGKLFRFGATAILNYYHQFHFYTSAS
ncbi:putative peroxisome membrane protein, Pex16 [Plasmopara halstedii]